MNQFNLLLKGSALRAIESIVAIVAGFITLPLMNSSLGGELYGLWVLIGGVIALMYIFDLGFASAVTQKISRSIATKDHERANEIISTGLAIYSALGILIAAVVFVVAIFYQPDLKNIISENEFKAVLILTGMAVAMEFPAKAFAGLAQAHLRHDLIALYRIIFKVLTTVCIVVFLLMGYKILTIAIINFIFSLCSTFAFVFVAQYVYKELNIKLENIKKGVFNDLFSFSAWAFLIDLNAILRGRIDLIFIGAYISLSAVSTYYIAIRLVDYAAMFLYKMLGITLPTMSQHAANQDGQMFKRDLLLFNRINMYAFSLGVVAFLIYGEAIFYYWLGNEFDYLTAYTILLIVGFGRLSAVSVDCYVTSFYAQGKHKVMAFNGFAETIFAVLMLYLTLDVYSLGVVYAAIAMTLPLVVFRFLLLPFLCVKSIGLTEGYQLILNSYRPAILIVLCGLSHFLYGDDIAGLSWGLLEESLIAAIIIVAFMWFDLRSREKMLIVKLLKSLSSRFR